MRIETFFFRSYLQDDQQKREEKGEQQLLPGAERSTLVVRGSYSYVVGDTTYTVNYVADQNGFQPQGDHIPPLPMNLSRAPK